MSVEQTANTRQVGGTHYKEMTVQTWDVIGDWPLDQQIGFYRGNALKYLMRMGTKDERGTEIAKCEHYLQKLLEVLNAAAEAETTDTPGGFMRGSRL